MPEIKQQFPFFQNNPDTIYLDSAATTQKPETVLKAVDKFYRENNANAGRSAYPLSTRLAEEVEAVRNNVATFLGASPAEIMFTSGATDGFNKIALSLALSALEDGDEILYAREDHTSFTLPWFQIRKLLKRGGVNIKLIPYELRKTGGADIQDILSKVTTRTRLINITHIHNVYGSDSDIQDLKPLREQGVIINVDATQSAGHIAIDVHRLGADILSFSGHKMFAMQGVGASFIDFKLAQRLQPVYVGGGGGGHLVNGDVIFANYPKCFEAGTLNYAGIISLGAAIQFINKIDLSLIESHLATLTHLLLKELEEISKIHFTKGPHYWNKNKCIGGYGILSFTIEGQESAEVGFNLAEHNILVRTGDFCSLQGIDSLNAVRVSLQIYNTNEDVQKFMAVMRKLYA